MSTTSDALGSSAGAGGAPKRAALQLDVYLHFDGTCEEALAFYKSVFGGEIVGLTRYGDAPQQADLPAGGAERVMHASFEAGDVKFMAADGPSGAQKRLGERVSLTLSTRDADEARRVFDLLAGGGEVTMPLQNTFWGALFGTVTDKYGIDWMVNASTR